MSATDEIDIGEAPRPWGGSVLRAEPIGRRRDISRFGHNDATSSCRGKQAFGSFALALRAMRRIRRRETGERVSVYRCGHCAHWHVGHH